MRKHRLAKLWRKLSDNCKQDGALWYYNMRNNLQTVADESGLPLWKVAAIFAALSPRIYVKKCLGMTRALLLENKEPKHFFCLRQKVTKLLKLDSSNEVATILNGPKIVAFYKNILGEESITVDVWMLRIYNKLSGDFVKNVTRAAYRKIAKFFASFASMIGWRQQDVQAALWLAITSGEI